VVDLSKVEIDIKKLLRVRYTNDKTVDLYAKRFLDLAKYYPATEPFDLSEAEINSYIKVLISRKDSRSLIIQFLQVIEYYFNHIHKKSYIFYRKNLPKQIVKKVTVLNQEDVFLMIDNTKNLKHKAILVIVYSCCIELSELLNIRITDLNSKRQPYCIQIRSKSGDVYRKAPISKKVIGYLNEYWKDCKTKPSEYFFEGPKPGNKYGRTSAEKMIKKSFVDIGISGDSVIKVLRHSYMSHMVDLGIPLTVVVESLGLEYFESIRRYSNSIHGNIEVNFTPLDKLIGNSSINEPEVEELERLIFTLKSKDEQEYLLEAIQCFRSGSLKAGIVFSWSSFIRYLQNKCIDKGYKKINESAEKLKFKKKFSKLTDFETIKETSLLALALELKVLSKHQKSQMDNNLDLRNHCGLPSAYKPEINKAKAFLEDIVNMMNNEPQQ